MFDMSEGDERRVDKTAYDATTWEEDGTIQECVCARSKPILLGQSAVLSVDKCLLLRYANNTPMGISRIVNNLYSEYYGTYNRTTVRVLPSSLKIRK